MRFACIGFRLFKCSRTVANIGSRRWEVGVTQEHHIFEVFGSRGVPGAMPCKMRPSRPSQYTFEIKIGEMMARRLESTPQQPAPEDCYFWIPPAAVLGKKSVKRITPSYDHVNRLVEKRAKMSWQNLAANTMELGTSYPLALVLVRDIEVRAEKAYTEMEKKRKVWVREKRARWVRFLARGGKLVKGKKTLILDAAGKVHKKVKPSS